MTDAQAPRAAGTGTASWVRPVAVAAVAFLAGFAFRLVAADDATSRPVAAPSPSSGASTGPADAGPGPTGSVAGVPAGFARTESGAVAAASSYVTTGQALLDMDPLAAENAVRQMAGTATADRQVHQALDDLAHLRDVLAGGRGPILFRQSALAARVERFDAVSARVSVWNVGVLSRDGVAAPQAGWQTSTFELVWERDDWRVAFEVITPGPAPTLDDSTAPATSRQLETTLDGFVALTGIPTAGGHS